MITGKPILVGFYTNYDARLSMEETILSLQQLMIPAISLRLNSYSILLQVVGIKKCR